MIPKKPTHHLIKHVNSKKLKEKRVRDKLNGRRGAECHNFRRNGDSISRLKIINLLTVIQTMSYANDVSFDLIQFEEQTEKKTGRDVLVRQTKPCARKNISVPGWIIVGNKSNGPEWPESKATTKCLFSSVVVLFFVVAIVKFPSEKSTKKKGV